MSRRAQIRGGVSVSHSCQKQWTSGVLIRTLSGPEMSRPERHTLAITAVADLSDQFMLSRSAFVP